MNPFPIRIGDILKQKVPLLQRRSDLYNKQIHLQKSEKTIINLLSYLQIKKTTFSSEIYRVFYQ